MLDWFCLGVCVIFDSSHPGCNKYLCPSQNEILTWNEDRALGFGSGLRRGEGLSGQWMEHYVARGGQDLGEEQAHGGGGGEGADWWPEGHLSSGLCSLGSWHTDVCDEGRYLTNEGFPFTPRLPSGAGGMVPAGSLLPELRHAAPFEGRLLTTSPLGVAPCGPSATWL